MNFIKKIFKQIKTRRTIRKINRALGVKLYDWQIAFIFEGRPYSAEIGNGRCNGKTLAHVLRACLKTDVNIPEPIIIRRSYQTDTFVFEWAGEDAKPIMRARFFIHELRDIYNRLQGIRGIKLRDIRFERKW